MRLDIKPKVIVAIFAVMLSAFHCFRDVSIISRFSGSDLRSVTIPGPIKAGNVDEAYAAWERRDYQAAMQLWARLAADGNETAQFNLGVMKQR